MPEMFQVGTSGPLSLVETLPALEGDGLATQSFTNTPLGRIYVITK